MGSAAESESPLWVPKPEEVQELRLEKLRKHVNQKYGLHLGTFSLPFTYISAVTYKCHL